MTTINTKMLESLVKERIRSSHNRYLMEENKDYGWNHEKVRNYKLDVNKYKELLEEVFNIKTIFTHGEIEFKPF